MAADNENINGLALLDLSAAFDTVDDALIFHHLLVSHHVFGHACDWFASYLHDRIQCVQQRNIIESSTSLQFEVLQGSVLSPVSFLLYTSDIPSIALKFGLLFQCYADDTQVYFHIAPNHTEELIDAIYHWLSNNCLKLKSDKMEIMLRSSAK